MEFNINPMYDPNSLEWQLESEIADDDIAELWQMFLNPVEGPDGPGALEFNLRLDTELAAFVVNYGSREKLFPIDIEDDDSDELSVEDHTAIMRAGHNATMHLQWVMAITHAWAWLRRKELLNVSE